MTAVLVWVGTGIFGALGALARFSRRPRSAPGTPATDSPAGTFVVNLSGAFALGMLTGSGWGATC